MYTITKQFSFEAAHHLLGLPAEHQCSRQHGHSYRVELVLQAYQLNLGTGFVVDYGELDIVGIWIKQNFDHQDLNEILKIQTSAENLCYFIFTQWQGRFPELVAVRVSETQKTWAEYRP